MGHPAFPPAGVRAELEPTTSIDAAGVDSDDPALEVRVRWGDSVLHVVHLSPPRPFVAGEDDDSDFRVARESLGAPRVVLPTTAGCYTHGNLAFDVIETRAARRDRLVAPVFSLASHRWTLASLGVHAALIGMIGLLPPGASALSLELLDADDAYSRYLITPSVLPDDPIEWLPERGEREGGREGQREQGEEGQMGDTRAPERKRRYQVPGPKDNPDPALRRHAAEQTARSGGLIAILQAASAGWSAPTSVYGRDNAEGNDPMVALGALLGHDPGSSFGFGGLGAKGTGRHGGGTGYGTIGIGDLATIGTYGKDGDKSGYGRNVGLRGDRSARVPQPIRVGKPDIAGALSKETIRRVIHRQLGQVRHCYEQSLHARPDLAGRVAVRFIIDPTGQVPAAALASSDLGHAQTEQCIVAVMRRLVFPAPDGGGLVKVTYPFVLDRTGG